MQVGVRDGWIEDVVAACRALMLTAVPQRTRSFRAIFTEFDAQLPSPRSPVEQSVLRALLVDLSVHWGHADHAAYHVEFPDAECADDPAALALTSWRSAPADAKAAFRAWVTTYIETIERIHPRYRAAELRRDLDASFAQPLSLTTLAAERGVTVRCLQRDFHELTGVSIQEYVTERRVDAAVRLLTETPDKVEWIANVVGWSSRKNLNRALGRRRGVSPAALRR